MKLKTIYKKNSAGKLQEWTAEIIDNKFRTISGQTNGKKITSEWKVCTGKNLGKSNETSPKEQAKIEAEAARRKKLEKDYVEFSENVDESSYISPMLAKEYKNYKDSLNFPVYIQPKLDGMRCINTEEGLISRNGKAITTCPHINKPIYEKLLSLVNPKIDGELYNHAFKENFNEIIRLVKRQNTFAEDLEETAKHINYWVYDLMCPGNFEERNAVLKDIFINQHTSPIVKKAGWVYVPTVKCENYDDIDKYYEKFLEQGFEGAIIRTNNIYENKRSNFLLKRKEFQDEEFPILNIVEGQGNRAGTAGYIETETKDKKPFRSNIKGDRAFITDLLVNKDQYIGKTATIKFFKYTPDGIPRFPVVIKVARENHE